MPVVAYPDSQSNSHQFVDQRPRIIIFAESGLLAGDLAAWLSGRFAVERATSIPGAGNAVDHGAQALILVGAEFQPLTKPLRALVDRCLEVGCGVIMLGGDATTCPDSWRGRVCLLAALPQPNEVFSALSAMVRHADQGRG